jgi:L-ascorbate metabolism protein UlaG (beta-lactamase superfamily)
MAGCASSLPLSRGDALLPGVDPPEELSHVFPAYVGCYRQFIGFMMPRLVLALLIALALSPGRMSAQTTVASDTVSLSTPLPADSTLRVTYVGNEGFLIELGDKKVLIDALYRTGVSGYVVHSPAVRSKLEGARPPFDNVDLVLASHHHADHFHPASVGMHLVKNKSSVFLSTKQSVEQMESDFRGYRTLAARIQGVFPEEGASTDVERNGITVRALNLHHGRGRPIQNLGFLVQANGYSILHVGDTEVTPDAFKAYGLDSARVDVFFLPYWFLAYDNHSDVVSSVAADVLVPMHIPPPDDPRGYLGDLGGFDAAVERIIERHPNAMIFTTPMEAKTFD